MSTWQWISSCWSIGTVAMQMPGRPFSMSRVATLALLAALALGDGTAQGAMPSGCAMPGTRILAEAAGDESEMHRSLVSIDPLDFSANRLPIQDPRTVTPLPRPGFVIAGDAAGRDHLVRLADGRTAPVPGAIATAVETTDSLLFLFRSPRWVTQGAYDAAGLRLRIVDRNRDRAVVDTVFPRRIEIAATATSADGRSVVHLQANNVASELTLFDAERETRSHIRIPHDASLAAYALSLTFSPDGSCLAVSMTRDGPLPESWMVDLSQPVLTATPSGNVFVLAWVDVPNASGQV